MKVAGKFHDKIYTNTSYKAVSRPTLEPGLVQVIPKLCSHLESDVSHLTSGRGPGGWLRVTSLREEDLLLDLEQEVPHHPLLVQGQRDYVLEWSPTNRQNRRGGLKE